MKGYFIKNTRPRLPLLFTAMLYLFMDKFNAPELLWGAFGVVMLIIWALSIYAVWIGNGVDIWQVLADQQGVSREDYIKLLDKDAPKKLTFKQRLELLQRDAAARQSKH